MNTGFCVIYRFKVRPGLEDRFKQGWTRMTKAIRAGRSGLGSRLHRTDDGLWIAYAQWPDRGAWERSRQMDPADDEAARMMAESVEESFTPIALDPIIDLLVPGK